MFLISLIVCSFKVVLLDVLSEGEASRLNISNTPYPVISTVTTALDMRSISEDKYGSHDHNDILK